MTDDNKYQDKAPETDKVTGARKNDLGKARWDLLPLEAVAKIVEIYTYGAAKYGPNNWQKLDDFENRYYAAMMRHLEAHRRGEMYDKESGFLHLAHVGWGAIALIWKALKNENDQDGVPAGLELGKMSYLGEDNRIYYLIQCDRCEGVGHLPGNDPRNKVCGKCMGNGSLLQNMRLAAFDSVRIEFTPAVPASELPETVDVKCLRCDGRGTIVQYGIPDNTPQPCPTCKGSGKMTLQKVTGEQEPKT